MKDWLFVVKRRKTTLELYLRGITSIEAALEKFKNNNIIPPPLEQIAAVVGQEIKPTVRHEAPKAARRYGSSSKKQSKSPRKSKVSVEENTGEIDEIVIIDTEDPFKD